MVGIKLNESTLQARAQTSSLPSHFNTYLKNRNLSLLWEKGGFYLGKTFVPFCFHSTTVHKAFRNWTTSTRWNCRFSVCSSAYLLKFPLSGDKHICQNNPATVCLCSFISSCSCSCPYGACKYLGELVFLLSTLEEI